MRDFGFIWQKIKLKFSNGQKQIPEKNVEFALLFIAQFCMLNCSFSVDITFIHMSYGQ